MSGKLIDFDVTDVSLREIASREAIQTSALRTSGTSTDVIESIFAMHYPDAGSVLDLTWGRGAFWKWPWRDKNMVLWANDLFAPLPDEDDQLRTLRWDARGDDLDRSPWHLWDVVVFDPPFTANGPQKNGRHQDRYGSTRDLIGAPQNIHDVHDLLLKGIVNACSLATQGVIVKTQDVIESGRYWDSESLACNAMQNSGFGVEDKVRLLTNRRSQPDTARGAKVRHFRNRPSVFIVGMAL